MQNYFHLNSNESLALNIVSQIIIIAVKPVLWGHPRKGQNWFLKIGSFTLVSGSKDQENMAAA